MARGRRTETKRTQPRWQTLASAAVAALVATSAIVLPPGAAAVAVEHAEHVHRLHRLAHAVRVDTDWDEDHDAFWDDDHAEELYRRNTFGDQLLQMDTDAHVQYLQKICKAVKKANNALAKAEPWEQGNPVGPGGITVGDYMAPAGVFDSVATGGDPSSAVSSTSGFAMMLTMLQMTSEEVSKGSTRLTSGVPSFPIWVSGETGGKREDDTVATAKCTLWKLCKEIGVEWDQHCCGGIGIPASMCQKDIVPGHVDPTKWDVVEHVGKLNIAETPKEKKCVPLETPFTDDNYRLHNKGRGYPKLYPLWSIHCTKCMEQPITDPCDGEYPTTDFPKSNAAGGGGGGGAGAGAAGAAAGPASAAAGV